MKHFAGLSRERFALLFALTLAVASGSAGCVHHPPKIDSLAGWDAKPAPPAGMRMTLMSSGTNPADYHDTVQGGAHKKVELPVICALVERPDGNLLIDTGYGLRFEKTTGHFPGSMLRSLLKPKFDAKTESVASQLPALGASIESIRWIVLTHMHWDHAGGLADFPNARLITTHAEWKAAHSRGILRGYIQSEYSTLSPEAMLVEWPKRPYGTFERSIDLFGDGSVILLDTSGHTPGSLSVLVTLPSGKRFLFIGDAAWVREGWQRPAEKSAATFLLDNSRNGTLPTLWRIKRFAELAPEIVVVPAHDPAVWSELNHAPAWYE